ncbi:MAG: hypothetical protein JNG86_05035 [Verrucomicrobiaceae bacterium]|nr:hypothetical protein [Verrucomicrobiaceae bacterium]
MTYDLRFTISIVTAVTLVNSVLASEPVEFPKLEAYAALWERSVFTTKDLPAADAPAGPSFVDNLTLLGLREVGGQLTATLSDKSTSMVYEAKMGSENEIGVKVRKVVGEVNDSKVRVQLQKGDQVGWVTVSEGNSAPAETVAPAGIAPSNAAPGLQTRQMPAAGAAADLLLPSNQSGGIPEVPTITPESTPPMSRRIIGPAPAAMPPAAPPPPVAVPAAAAVDGIPLPPP